jgi:hypothetical protein
MRAITATCVSIRVVTGIVKRIAMGTVTGATMGVVVM